MPTVQRCSPYKKEEGKIYEKKKEMEGNLSHTKSHEGMLLQVA